MIESEGSASAKDHVEETENAREGYQAAITLWTCQSSLNWNRFNVMMTANSIVLAIIGLTFTGRHPLPVIQLGRLYLAVFPMIGLGLCIAWFFLTARGYEWHKYWGLSARELEERYLDSIQIVSRSHAFSKGKSITLKIGAKPFATRMGWWARVAHSQRWISYAVILVFMAVYLLVWAFFTV